jgi:hypothetical protein
MRTLQRHVTEQRQTGHILLSGTTTGRSSSSAPCHVNMYARAEAEAEDST